MDSNTNALRTGLQATAPETDGTQPSAATSPRVRANMDPRFLFEKGLSDLRQGEFEQAAELFELVLRNTPNHAEARCNLLIAFMRLERWPAALRVSIQYLEGHAHDAAAWVRHAICQRHNGQEPAAEKSLKRALKLDPECSAAWAETGRLQLERKHLRRAQKAFERLLELKPRSSKAFEGLASIARIQGDDNTALDQLALAARFARRPFDRIRLFDELSRLQAEREQTDRAIQSLLEAARLAPTPCPERLFRLGSLYLQANNRLAAETAHQKLEPLDANLARRLHQMLSL